MKHIIAMNCRINELTEQNSTPWELSKFKWVNPFYPLIHLPFDEIEAGTLHVDHMFAGRSGTRTVWIPFTNYDYEVKLNEGKRRIKILRPEYLNTYISEHREIMEYEESSDYISKRVKGTYNPRISGV